MSDVQLSLPGHELAPEPVTKTVEEWAALKKTDLQWFVAAKFARRWGLGRMVPETIFDTAIHEVQTIVLR